ncbi:hypothetical protein [Xanthomonas nasturtii]|uniref:hypothetical protein n=2 Tax=Xanthomonas TaxID=338 RepID=UPI002B238B04|nr:hypothetical protein [Xanthomonas nasturtii]
MAAAMPFAMSPITALHHRVRALRRDACSVTPLLCLLRFLRAYLLQPVGVAVAVVRLAVT